jgi:hypothetical protein
MGGNSGKGVGRPKNDLTVIDHFFVYRQLFN